MSLRAASKKINLSNLSPSPGSIHKAKRVGRGQGSRRGGTAGRGTKGQKSRSGPGPRVGFEGGQTPLTKLIPKRGFYNHNTKTYVPVNLDRIQHWIDQGRLTSSPDKPLTARELLLSGCVHGVGDGIKLLGDGSESLRTPIHIIPSRASKSAIKAVESVGGSIFCQYYNALGLRDCIKGNTHRLLAAPVRRTDIEWYTNWRNRGYLSPTAIDKMPGVDDRLRELSRELRTFKSQSFEKPKSKS